MTTEQVSHKPRTKPPRKELFQMDTNATVNDLDALGLGDMGLDTAPEAAKSEPVAIATEAATVAADVGSAEGAEVAAKKQTREHINVGTIEIEEDVELPALTRNSGGSKYKFDELRAPVKKADGTYSYASFRVDLVPPTTEVGLKRSVQSAAAAQNKGEKGAKTGLDGDDTYFITRSVVVSGKFTAMRVFRVDGTTSKED